MSRIYDLLMSENHLPNEQRRRIKALPVFDIGNIATYYAGFPLREWHVADFPNVAPPFGAWWMEFRLPDEWTPAYDILPYAKRIRGYGVICTGEQWNSQADEFQDASGQRVEIDCSWLLDFYVVPLVTMHHVEPPWWQFHFLVSKSGRLALPAEGDPAITTPAFSSIPLPIVTRYGLDSAPNGRLANIFRTHCIYPCLLALSFMHCKNVVTRVERPPDWQQKAAVKKHKRPLVTYHVLEIEPMKQVLRTEGKSEEVGLKRALHICRGHFATYDEKPLFGRVKGTFWREAHVRGSLKEGLALKDYDVKAPTPIR